MSRLFLSAHQKKYSQIVFVSVFIKHMSKKSADNNDMQDKKQKLDEYLSGVFERCSLSNHTGNVSVLMSFFQGKFQAAKATWDENVVK